MMNKSKIDWCDFSWNPVTGCRNKCEYCYARKQALRFSGDIRVNKRSDQLEPTMHYNPELDEEAYFTYILKHPFKNETGANVPFPVGFEPILHEYRLCMPAQKKKPANIFVCSMADLFGDWVPEEWIMKVFEACKDAPWHNYLFLTKNPKRYCKLANEGKLPQGDNYWYGTTVTGEDDTPFCSGIYNTFLSIEPLRRKIKITLGECATMNWIIVGAETGKSTNKITPKKEWIDGIVSIAHAANIPILLKDSKEIRAVWDDDLVQEYPEGLCHEEAPPIPHCKKCEYCTKKPDGMRGYRYYCEIGWTEEGYDDRGARHIIGRYTRSSPPWCCRRSSK